MLQSGMLLTRSSLSAQALFFTVIRQPPLTVSELYTRRQKGLQGRCITRSAISYRPRMQSATTMASSSSTRLLKRKQGPLSIHPIYPLSTLRTFRSIMASLFQQGTTTPRTETCRRPSRNTRQTFWTSPIRKEPRGFRTAT